MGDAFWAGISEHFKGELAVVSGAPFLFILAALAVGTVAFFLLRGHFSERMETQAARIEFLGDQLAEYKDKLSGATPAEAARELVELRKDLGVARSEVTMLVEWHQHQTSDRRLNADQELRLVERLKILSDHAKTIINMSAINHPEPQQYAQDLMKAFKKAGFCVNQTYIGQLFISSADEVGVLVTVPDLDNKPDYAIAIFEALQSAGVDAVWDQYDTHKGERCSVMVSYKKPHVPTAVALAHP